MVKDIAKLDGWKTANLAKCKFPLCGKWLVGKKFKRCCSKVSTIFSQTFYGLGFMVKDDLIIAALLFMLFLLCTS